MLCEPRSQEPALEVKLHTSVSLDLSSRVLQGLQQLSLHVKAIVSGQPGLCACHQQQQVRYFYQLTFTEFSESWQNPKWYFMKNILLPAIGTFPEKVAESKFPRLLLGTYHLDNRHQSRGSHGNLLSSDYLWLCIYCQTCSLPSNHSLLLWILSWIIKFNKKVIWRENSVILS